ncbi:MAG: NAD(P)H-dependent oxidoreductase [Clostridia bacterium]|nr:NAD(P)H-dependent oxidoreductase [Clostridia bacterium]
MKILVLNGSPKGRYSITLQTSNYLEILHPEHEFDVLNLGAMIKSLERDFTEAVAKLEWADLLIFSYPVYTFIAPYQLHRFIELIKESGIDLSGKIATEITTSKHFYDFTAHKYVEENCHDLGLNFIAGLSADMDDLTTKKGRLQAEKFFDYLVFSVENRLFVNNCVPNNKIEPVTFEFEIEEEVEKSGDVVIVTDCEEDNSSLKNMIAYFRMKLPRATRVINIRECNIKGGCLGCFGCATKGKCVYSDGFDTFLREKIQTADSIVYAFTVKDHSMGSRFKMYDDRQFCNGHRTVTIGMPIGYLVSGNLSRESNLSTILSARADVGSNFLAGIATDERDPKTEIDNLVLKLTFALENKYQPPQSFYGIGGMKIFRDLIWLMQGMMKADHKFFKSHGQYDFPQKKRGMMLKMYLVGALISSPKIKAKMGNKMNEGMIAPYKKALDRARARMEQK